MHHPHDPHHLNTSQHQPSPSVAAASADRGDLPTYEEVVSTFSWDQIFAMCDWPIHEKCNLAHELCDRWADHPDTADRIALRYETRDGERGAYTYRELQDLANRCANALSALGIARGDRVAGLLSKHPAVLPTVLGAWKLGAVYVPIFTAFAPPAIAFRLRHSGARAVVTDATNLAKLREAQTLGEGLPDLRHTLVVADETASFDDAHPADAHPFWAMLHTASPSFTTVETTRDELAAIQFTSGSTGEPKGAMIRHGWFVYVVLPLLRYALDLRVEDVFWGMADPGWAYGLFICLLGPLALGASSLLIEAPFTPASCWEVLGRYRVTNFTTAPTAYRALATAGVDLARERPAPLRVATSAGEPLNPEVYEWFRRELGIAVHDMYGQTETGLLVANYAALRWAIKPGSMGRPLPGFAVAIVDEQGSEVPAGVVGQIAVRRTEVVMRAFGYWQAPEKTAAGFRGEWWLTGDLARRDADGYVWFEGRADDMIKSSGYRIGPFEIESALLMHPAVAESAVIGVPDPQHGVAIKAFVVLKPEHEGQEASDALVEALQQVVRDHVGKHAFPRAVEFVTSLPKTESGKIQRFLLRQREQRVTSE